MPLKGIPSTITPELLYAMARMGHGDRLCIADANFPSDSIAKHSALGSVIRITIGSTAELLRDVLKLLPIDDYADDKIVVMDRVQSDKDKDLPVLAYSRLQEAAGSAIPLSYVERFQFYEAAKSCFCIIQTTDATPYANVIISKGVLSFPSLEPALVQKTPVVVAAADTDVPPRKAPRPTESNGSVRSPRKSILTAKK